MHSQDRRPHLKDAALFVDLIEAVVIGAHILHLEFVEDLLQFGNGWLGHWLSSSLMANLDYKIWLVTAVEHTIEGMLPPV
jgi:hypothetical protein